MHVCSQCFVQKQFSEFSPKKGSKLGIHSACKKCRSATAKERHKTLSVDQLLRLKEVRLQWEKKNPQYKSTYQREYNQKNKKVLAEKKIKYNRDKTANNLLFAFSRRVRACIRSAFKRNNHRKTSKTVSLLGCSIEFAKLHIERQFTKGMNWEAFKDGQIHLDHIIPISSAATEEEVIKLNHFTNLRPMWAVDNLRKGAKQETLL